MAGVCISAVGDRHALQSVYYSTMKKTLTPLNDVYMRRVRRAQRHRHQRASSCDDARNERATV